MTAPEDGPSTDAEDDAHWDVVETPPDASGDGTESVDGTPDAGRVDPRGAPIPDGDSEVSRKQAALYISPFLLLGLADVVLLLGWGLDPLWGFMILPPILFISFLGWIAFKYGFVRDHEEQGYDGDDAAPGE